MVVTKLHKSLLDIANQMELDLLSADFDGDIEDYQKVLDHLALYGYVEPPTAEDRDLLDKVQKLINAKKEGN